MVSMSWAGQYLRAVQIDSYGQFPFILVKVSDRTSAHRLLVRGKNNSSTAELYQAVTQEVHLQPPRPAAPPGLLAMYYWRKINHLPGKRVALEVVCWLVDNSAETCVCTHTAQVKVACKQHKLATISVALLGSGVMEWSRERDRRINVSSGAHRDSWTFISALSASGGAEYSLCRMATWRALNAKAILMLSRTALQPPADWWLRLWLRRSCGEGL